MISEILLPMVDRGIDNTEYIEYNAGMNKLQYTIRNIPPDVDKVIRKRAKRKGKSFNTTVVEALMMQTLGSTDIERAGKDVFDRLRGANTLDNGFDAAIEDQSKTDDSIWR